MKCKIFEKEIDLQSRAAMLGFLQDHFRYNTMNSWNYSSSYANNVKIDELNLPHEIVMKLLDMIDVDGFYDSINDLIAEFGAAHDYLWQAGFNGRSGGYLVLYMGGSKPSEYKSHCTACGQRNYTSVKETGPVCGRCGQAKRVDFEKPPLQIFSYPGKSVDQDAENEDWTIEELRERVKLITEFDRLCDDVVAEAVGMAENFDVGTEEVTRVEEVRVLVEK